MDILIDFDGTVVGHNYPGIGDDIGAVKVLRKIVENGHNLILFTMRDGAALSDAVGWFNRNNIPLYGIQENPTQKKWTSSPKAYGQKMIDDSAIGCPLLDRKVNGRDAVDWDALYALLLRWDIIKE